MELQTKDKPWAGYNNKGLVRNLVEDSTLFNINIEIFKQKIKPISNYQRWASYIIPYYEVLQGIIFLSYFIKNYNRDTIIVLIEIDYILENYRIWKRNGIAN